MSRATCRVRRRNRNARTPHDLRTPAPNNQCAVCA
jgi:hypothetical protein